MGLIFNIIVIFYLMYKYDLIRDCFSKNYYHGQLKPCIINTSSEFELFVIETVTQWINLIY